MRKGISSPVGSFNGYGLVPGDKSVSHRALMLGALTIGRTSIRGLLESEDVISTMNALRALGAQIENVETGEWIVTGVGIGGLVEPNDILDMGNAGTGARLLMGILAGHNLTTFLTGDSSLRARPMARVTAPLVEMGAQFLFREGGLLPMAIVGAVDTMPIIYKLPMPSAQVKSAILFAGLNAPGETIVIEEQATRDHTERMMSHFGASINSEVLEDGFRRITLTGQPELTANDVAVPRDISSAAFPIVGALIVENSEVKLEGVGRNPHRDGLIVTLREMGAKIEETKSRKMVVEPVSDLVVVNSRLKGVTVPSERAPSMIDEYPILAIAAAYAEGDTRMCGLGELRVKESDRLLAIKNGLKSNGVNARIEGDDLIISGCPDSVPGGGKIQSCQDHRIAMSFLTMGLGTKRPVVIDDVSPINTSFPDFDYFMNKLGAAIEVDNR